MTDVKTLPLDTLAHLRADFEAEAKANGKGSVLWWHQEKKEYADFYIQKQWLAFVEMTVAAPKDFVYTNGSGSELEVASHKTKWDHLPAEVAAEAAARSSSTAVATAEPEAPAFRTATFVPLEEGLPRVGVSTFTADKSTKMLDPNKRVLEPRVDDLEQAQSRTERRQARFVDTSTGDLDIDLTLLHKSVDDILLMEMEILRKLAEENRRERPLMDGRPVPLVMDYGSAGNAVSYAMHHLDESLPNGQKKRSEYAYKLLAIGVEKLGIWMQAKGYEV